jgi:hypothetical protein
MSDILAAPTVDVQGGLSDMVRAILLFLPKALLFVLILVVGFIVARIARKVVDRILERVGFDGWVERGGIRSALARTKYDASDLVAKLVYYAILLFTLQLAFGVWGPNPVSDLIGSVVAWLPRAFVAIIIVVVAAAIAAAVRDLISAALGGLSYGRLLAKVASYFIIGLGVIAALNQIGVATTVTMPVLIAVLATIAGILIIGVGGGLVKPMQGRWEDWLSRAAAESQTIAEHARAYSAGQRDARDAMTEQDPNVTRVGAAVPPMHTPADPTPVVSSSASRTPARPATTAPTATPISEQPTQVIPPVNPRDPA